DTTADHRQPDHRTQTNSDKHVTHPTPVHPTHEPAHPTHETTHPAHETGARPHDTHATHETTTPPPTEQPKQNPKPKCQPRSAYNAVDTSCNGEACPPCS